MTLKFYKYKNLESVFIEVLSKSGKINTVGCTYQHLNLTRQEFMDTFLEPFLDKFSYESKNIIFLCDFDTDLPRYVPHIQTR